MERQGGHGGVRFRRGGKHVGLGSVGDESPAAGTGMGKHADKDERAGQDEDRAEDKRGPGAGRPRFRGLGKGGSHE